MNRGIYSSLMLLFALVLMIGFFGVCTKNFLQPNTFFSIANQIPALSLVAVGMTFVLLIGGIDLSVGSVLALSSAVLGTLMVDHGWSLLAAMPVCVMTGACCGLLNGIVSVGAKIPSFIVTLGMLEIARGAAKWVSDSQTKYIGSPVAWMGEPIGGIGLSPAFIFAICVIILAQLVLSCTLFGRYCVAIGTNERAVEMSGIRPAFYKITVFAACGCLCGVAALGQTSLLSSADPNAAIGIELSAIAACVIGGTSLMGGRGNVVKSFIGVLIIAVLQTGLAQMGVSDPMKQIMTGVVIVVAVLMDALRVGAKHHS